MKVIVSACLLGERCKYNGKSNYNRRVVNFLKGCEVISICPEVLGGMSIPRPSCEIRKGRIVDTNGNDFTSYFKNGVNKAVNIIDGKEINMAILQSRSPSCGVNQIYDGSFSGILIPGKGLFAQKLINMGYKVIDSEDI